MNGEETGADLVSLTDLLGWPSAHHLLVESSAMERIHPWPGWGDDRIDREASMGPRGCLGRTKP